MVDAEFVEIGCALDRALEPTTLTQKCAKAPTKSGLGARSRDHLYLVSALDQLLAVNGNDTDAAGVLRFGQDPADSHRALLRLGRLSVLMSCTGVACSWAFSIGSAWRGSQCFATPGKNLAETIHSCEPPTPIS